MKKNLLCTIAIVLSALTVAPMASAVANTVTMVTQAPKGETLRIQPYPYDATITGADAGDFFGTWISQGPGTTITVTAENLTQLEVYRCSLSELDVKQAPSLNILKCYENAIGALDISANTELNILDCHKNQIASIDASANTQLENLRISDNKITNVKLGSLPKLTLLECGYNPLSALDVSGCPKLEELYFENCGLPDVNLSSNPKLWWIFAFGNNLAGESMETFLENLPMAEYTGMLYIVDTLSEAPESNVCTMMNTRRAAMKGWATMDYTNGNGTDTQLGVFYPGCDYVPEISENSITLTTSRAAGETIKLSISASGSVSVSGVTQTSSFTGTNTYTLTDNTVVIKGDVTSFECPGNDIQSLTFTGEPLVTYLDCRDNAIENLDLTGAAVLKTLYAQNNRLTSLNLTDCVSLMRVDCYQNSLSGRGMTQFVNSLYATDVEPLLYIIDTKAADEHNVATVNQVAIALDKGWEVYDYSGGDRFGMGVEYAGSEPLQPEEYFTVTRSSKDVMSLTVNYPDASYTPVIEGGELVAWNGSGLMFRMLDETVTVYGDAIELQTLFAYIEGIDVSGLPNLEKLNVALNDITEIDLTQNSKLTEFSCEGNLLSALDFSGNPKLRYINCYGNNIKGANMTAMMTSLPKCTKDDYGTLIVHDETYTINSNICLTTDVAIAKSKYWLPCEVVENDIVPYDGIDPAGIEDVVADSKAPVYDAAAGVIYTAGEADVYSLAGRLVANGQGQISVSHLPAGIYIVKAGKAVVKIVK